MDASSAEMGVASLDEEGRSYVLLGLSALVANKARQAMTIMLVSTPRTVLAIFRSRVSMLAGFGPVRPTGQLTLCLFLTEGWS